MISLPSLPWIKRICLALTLSCIASFFLPSPNQKLLSTSLLVGSYLAFCLQTLVRHRTRQDMGQPDFPDHLEANQAGVLIAYASQTGYAEQIARKTALHLREASMQVAVVPLSAVKLADLSKIQRILFVVSTTGEGDAPDHVAGFTRHVMSQQPDLSHLQFAVLALGDRHYQHFCAFGHRLAHWLTHQSAHSLFDLVEVDNGDEAALRHWQHHLGLISGHTELTDWSKPGYQDWILAERELLNPGSLGGPVYRIACYPPPTNPNAPNTWSAGDIAEVGPGYPADTDTIPATDRPVLPHREYSIASLPTDGKLELLVRQMRRPDGSLGIGSGWLTAHTAIGQTIQLRIRENRNFHAPAQDCPLILVGNGTGLAGLRAHIKTRAASKHPGNWLIFGERQAAHDYFHRTELEAWLAKGTLSKLDLCFSRDQEEKRYVQHVLLEQQDELRHWVKQGSAILVCGSLQGMAEAVNHALTQILGTTQLEQMTEAGLYRRDVY